MINKAILIGFIFMCLICINLSAKLKKAEEKKVAEETIKTSIIMSEDSLCEVWVKDTATRVAFKHWYKKQLNKKK